MLKNLETFATNPMLSDPEEYPYLFRTWYWYVELSYVVLLQMICCVQAFRARKLPNLFNDSIQIAAAMFCATLVMLITLPLVSSYTKPKHRHFIISTAILSVNFLLLLIVYCGKVVSICVHWKDSNRSGEGGHPAKHRRTVTWEYSSKSTEPDL